MDIVTDEAFLRQPSEPVANKSEAHDIARKLNYAVNRINVRALRAEKHGKSLPYAIGLSAPQIGILKQACVLAIGQFRMALINPRIVAHATHKIEWEEGCLSFPGQVVKTYRWPWIQIESMNLNTTLGTEDLGNAALLLRAVAAQHEIAHLRGLLHFDFSTPEAQPAFT